MTARTSAGLLAVAVAVSAGIHTGLTPEHLSEMPRLGQAFIVASVLGAAIAIALVLWPDDTRIAAIGGLFCLGQIIAWMLFVTIRVPFFAGTPESVENIALISKGVEVVGLGLAAGVVWRRALPRRAAVRGASGRVPIAANAATNFRAATAVALAAITATAIVTMTADGVLGSMSAGIGNTPGVTASSITFGSYQPLTGPAGPGYSEIAPAAQAYFEYVNDHGGVFGRKIRLIYKDDADNVRVVRQLVRRDHVFAMVGGATSPTQPQVVHYLNAERVPDIFVGSGCPCWDDGYSQPFTFGWQPSYTIEGKILGQYIEQHFPGQRVGVLYEDDVFGRSGLAGIDDEVPGADIVAKQGYRLGAATLAPQLTALQSAGAEVLVDFTVPTYTAMSQQTAAGLGYRPHLLVSNAGSDPTQVAAQLKTISKGSASGAAPIEGAITDGYLPSPTALANPWIHLFRTIHTKYDSSAPFDSNVVYGMASAYTVVEALAAVGQNLTRQRLVDAINAVGGTWKGPGLVPFRYSVTDHGGFAGVQMGQIRGGKIVLFGNPLTTDATAHGPISPYSALTPPPPSSGIATGNQVTNGYVMNSMTHS